ncbi:MAG: caspase family protein [Deltaproteobacteria bacterium]|nr:caspase family protein [Deltaproteobacteria bacterium]
MLRGIGLFVLSCLLASPAAADGGTSNWALLVGSNRPGRGQEQLRFAHRDAERVRGVLAELGGFADGQICVLADPDRGALLAELDRLAASLEAEQRKDRQSVFVFFYSGHARSSALDLGSDAVALDELKALLARLPATVTLVVLDACQAGAISSVKGVEPAADFSHNSVRGLDTAGMAVMASSSGAELSQESERLEGSFFTHHLVTGLRGAADANADGRVTLAEAYGYAYDRTLVSTASTAVGSQHVTLETDMRGKGEMVITRPAEAGTRLQLPDWLDAELLVHRAADQHVMAEIRKASGKALELALPPGSYTALLRRDEGVTRCAFELEPERTLAFRDQGCEAVPEAEVTVKGEARSESPVERLGFELALGGLFEHRDAYVGRLVDFGFEKGDWLFDDPAVHYSASVSVSLTRYLALVLTFGNLDDGHYTREIQEMSGEFRPQGFDWDAYRLGVAVRGQLPLLDGWLVPYVQAGGGLAFGMTDFADGELADSETHYGYHLAAAAGLQLVPSIAWWRYVGGFAQVEYIYAPVIDNLVGDTHDSGGFAFVLGVRACF